MLELLKGPQWFSRSLCQLRTLQKPIRCIPTLSLKHCTVRCLPMTSLSSDLGAIQPREPDNVVVVFILVTAAGRSFNDTHALRTSHSLDTKCGSSHAQNRFADPKGGKSCLQPSGQCSGELTQRARWRPSGY